MMRKAAAHAGPTRDLRNRHVERAGLAYLVDHG